MHIHIDVDHDDVLTDNPKRLHAIRAAAYFLLHAIGDLQDDPETSDGNKSDGFTQNSNGTPPKPPVAPAAMAPAVSTAVASAVASITPILAAQTFPTGLSGMGSLVLGNVPPPPTTVPAVTASNIPPPPPPPIQNHYPSESGDAGDYDDETGDSNVVNFPTAGTVPPPPPANIAATPAPSGNVAPIVVAATDVVSVPMPLEFDSAGMPWDARIHQKAKGQKKDKTWKLIKGIDPAIVQAVTAELAARKVIPDALKVPLPPTSTGSNSVPVPPVTNVPAPPGVPAPPASAPVSVPPPPAVGTVGASPYRALIDKIAEFTKVGKLAPAKVAEVCQSHGAPSLMALNSMQTQMSLRDPGLTILQAVVKDIDAAALGIL